MYSDLTIWYSSLISYFIERKFHPPQGLRGTIMSATLFCSTLSNIFSSAIAKRIGLIKMVTITTLSPSRACSPDSDFHDHHRYYSHTSHPQYSYSLFL